MLSALGCTQNKKAINEYLSIAISGDGSIRSQNVLTAFSSIYSAEKFGADACLEFLMNNYKAVFE